MARIRLKYVHRDTDRHGNVRYYFYKRGAAKKLRLPGIPGSAEFMAAYDAALKGLPLPKPQSPEQLILKRAPAGTFSWLCSVHCQCPEFKALEAGTQKNKRGILRQICDVAIAPGSKVRIGDLPYAEMTSKAVRMLRDYRADQPGTANNWLATLNTLFAWAIEAEHASANPARDVPKLKRQSEGHHTWTVEEMRRFEAAHGVGTQPRLAFALLAYTGQRRSDVVVLGRQHLTKDGGLRFVQRKNRKRKPVTVEIPLLPVLAQVIDATPTGHLTFLLNAFGKPWHPDGFSNKFRVWCDEAGLPHCSAHGLRKAAACAAAEGGATEMQMMAIFGWRDAAMARVYTEKASRGKMAAQSMHLLANHQNKDQTNVSHLADVAEVGGKNRRKKT